MKILKNNFNITNLSNFKTKAFTKYYFEINDESDVLKLKEIFDFAEKENLKTLFIGGGTNVLFAFDLFEGIIIKNNLKGFSYDESTKILEVYSNEKIWEVAEKLENDYSQNLWHRFIGLPGSIGGAVFGNAGCFGLETESNFLEANVYNLSTGEIENFSKDDTEFSYRNSIFKESTYISEKAQKGSISFEKDKNSSELYSSTESEFLNFENERQLFQTFHKETGKYFIIKAKFDLSKLEEKYSSEVDNIKFREEVQPKGNSCGSFFKNPSKEFSAGKLIEEVGLKGFHHKTAYFSEKHANFLMTNTDNGDYNDLLYLIDLAKNKVREKFGVELEAEVRIIL